MSKFGGEYGPQHIPWRTLVKMDSDNRATVLDAVYTAAVDRSPRQARAIEQVIYTRDKVARRIANVNIAHGSVHTSNGQTRFMHGVGTRPTRS